MYSTNLHYSSPATFDSPPPQQPPGSAGMKDRPFYVLDVAENPPPGLYRPGKNDTSEHCRVERRFSQLKRDSSRYKTHKKRSFIEKVNGVSAQTSGVMEDLEAGYGETDGDVTIREFVEHCSLHGIWRITNSAFPVARRLLWFLALIGCIVLLVFAFVEQLRLFLEFRVQTTISVEEEDFLEFPAVTICNFNQFRKSYVSKHEGFVDTLKAIFPLPDETDSPGVGETPPPFQAFQSVDLEVTEVLIDAAHTLDDMVLVCYWAGVRLPCAKYFQRTFTEVGVCYTLNSLETRKYHQKMLVHDAGSDNGLLLRINIENDEYFYGESNSAGVRVLVHDPKELPLIRQLGFVIGPGTSTVAAVEQVQGLTRFVPGNAMLVLVRLIMAVLKHLAKSPYGPCIDTNHPRFINPLTYYSEYSYPACKAEHRSLYVFAACKCVMFYEAGNVTVCKTVEDYNCARQAIANFTMYKSQEVRKACPRKCQSVEYSVKLSTAKFPAQHILEDLNQKYNESDTFIRNNFLELLIFYQSMGIQKIHETPAYTITALFSDVGGQMGLCIGASLLTVIEIFEFVSAVFMNKLRMLGQRQRRTKR